MQEGIYAGGTAFDRYGSVSRVYYLYANGKWYKQVGGGPLVPEKLPRRLEAGFAKDDPGRTELYIGRLISKNDLIYPLEHVIDDVAIDVRESLKELCGEARDAVAELSAYIESISQK